MTVWNGHATCHHRNYRLTCEQYDRLLRRADGHCEICGIAAEDTPAARLGIDHDHHAGDGQNHVRGMLCAKCNCNLKYPERGDRPFTDAERRYLANAWCVLEPPAAVVSLVSAESVRFSVEIPRELRDEFTRTVTARREDRSQIVEDLLRWYLRRSDARTPNCPPAA